LGLAYEAQRQDELHHPWRMARAQRKGRAPGVGQRIGRSTPSNALTVRSALADWFAQQIEPRCRRTSNVRTYVRRATAAFGDRCLMNDILGNSPAYAVNATTAATIVRNIRIADLRELWRPRVG
jgi:hypothetical protein